MIERGLHLSVTAFLLAGTLLLSPAWPPTPAHGADQTAGVQQPPVPEPVLRISRTEDFEVNGRGDAPAWEKARWAPLSLRPAAEHSYQTRVKVLYSRTGLYVLMDAADQAVTATMQEDFLDLWNEDVFEFFLWPDERYPLYFEYEISPLGYELPILIPNLDGKFLGWRPWHYEGPRKTRKATTVAGGAKQAGAEVSGWKAEVVVPYELLTPLGNVPPEPGTRWRANFYRVDYDGGKRTSWDWARVGPSFHEFRKFGTLVFE
ncbi:MAG TPA: carbohydrate-binding family 9-like protein [Candidatus Anammoximicrobium sp.]|nr:carbohydrate-binding family 9-like protein [Candidatus Anammoximicrobium sp.]